MRRAAVLLMVLFLGCGGIKEISGRSRPGTIRLGEAKAVVVAPLVDVVSPSVDVDQIPMGSKMRQDDAIGIVFGIEDYKNTFTATYKKRDAVIMHSYFRDVLGIPEERLLLRTDDDATKAEFDYVFEPLESEGQGWLKKRLGDRQEAAKVDIYIYLAGHGFPDLRSGQPYLIPYDVRPEQASNGVALEDLYRDLNDFGARSVTVFVESCFSGASGYDREGSERLLALNMNPVFRTVEKPMIGSSMVVMSATSGESPSSNRDDLQHGIFTYFVLKGLGGAGDLNNDGDVTVGELFTYLRAEVPPKAYEPPLDREQIPELLPPPSRLGERGNRVLVRY